MKEEEFKKICLELGGVFSKDEYGALICIFPYDSKGYYIPHEGVKRERD